MVTTALWSYLLASTACVSAYAVGGGRTEAPEIASFCGTVGNQSAPRTVRRANEKGFQSKQPVNSSVLLPIDVYMQVLSLNGTEEGGDMSDERINAQMKLLNDAFRPVGYEFNIVETIRTTNEKWYQNLQVANRVEDEVSLALRKGGNATLNIYTMGELVNGGGSPAWATVPSDLPWRGAYDGVFIRDASFLGGNHPIFRKGVTLIHEVGHWFGLYHTFGNGCEASYDFVADTPIEDLLIDMGGCPIGMDSCPNQPGVDLIHNYMTLTDDDCRNSWTPGQIQRMREQTAKFRGIVYPGIDVDNIPEDSY